MVPAKHDKANNQGILNALLYIILAYQFVLLIIGNLQYKPLGHVHDGLYVFSIILIYVYISSHYTKEADISWNRSQQKWLNLEDYENGELDKDEPEKMYYRQKRFFLMLAIIFSTLAVIFALMNIVHNSVVLAKYIISTFGVSASAVFILTMILGVKIIMRFIQKPWKERNLIFNMLILQNFLLSTAILKMLSNIRG